MKKIIYYAFTAVVTLVFGMSNAQDMKPLNLELPQAQFVGTPTDFQVSNLQIPMGPRGRFYAPEGVTNVAKGKLIESSDDFPVMGEIDMINDGDKEAVEGSYVELNEGPQHITFDLEGKHAIYAIVVWHFHQSARVYHDVVVQISDDPDFMFDVQTVFNNDMNNSLGLGVGEDPHYVETYEGRLVDAQGYEGRYVRLYSNGNTSNDLNHYIEVEIYGKPAS
ncbi:MAG: hypothetical protein ACOC1J_03425 [Prolixibacteraceae bacterium]